MAVFLDFNQHSSPIYWAIFSLSFRNFLLFTLGPGDRKIMLTFIELLIGVVVIVGVAATSLKGIPPLVCYLSVACYCDYQCHYGAQSVTVQPGFNRHSATDIVEYVKILLMSRGGDSA